VSGSYDRFLFGFQCSTSGRDEVSEVDSCHTFYPTQHRYDDKSLQTSYVNAGLCVQADIHASSSQGMDPQFEPSDIMYRFCLTRVNDVDIPMHVQGPVKCVAAAAPYLVSGGADDLVHLYDMQASAGPPKLATSALPAWQQACAWQIYRIRRRYSAFSRGAGGREYMKVA